METSLRGHSTTPSHCSHANWSVALADNISIPPTLYLICLFESEIHFFQWLYSSSTSLTTLLLYALLEWDDAIKLVPRDLHVHFVPRFANNSSSCKLNKICKEAAANRLQDLQTSSCKLIVNIVALHICNRVNF